MTANDLLLKLLQMKLDNINLNELSVVCECTIYDNFGYDNFGPCEKVENYIDEVQINECLKHLVLN